MTNPLLNHSQTSGATGAVADGDFQGYSLVIESLLQVSGLLEPDTSSVARSSWLAARVLLNLPVQGATHPERMAVLKAAHYFLEVTSQRTQQTLSTAALSVLSSVSDLLRLHDELPLAVSLYQRNLSLQRSLNYCRNSESADSKQVLAAIDQAMATAERPIIDCLYLVLGAAGHRSLLTKWLKPNAHDASGDVDLMLMPKPLQMPMPQPINVDPDLLTLARLACPQGSANETTIG